MHRATHFAARWRSAAVSVAFVLSSVAWAADDGLDLRRLFPFERDIYIERDGLVRLALPADVLTECRPDLSDLRVFDRSEREVPYVVDASVPPGEAVAIKHALDAQVLSAKREEVTPEDAPPRYRETYEIAAPPSGETPWDLVFGVGRPQFVARVELAAVGADGERRTFDSEDSIFRLTSPAAEKLRIALPPLAEERLVVSIERENDGYLEPKLRYETSRVLDARGAVVVPLDEISRSERDGRTVVELARPRGLLPDALRIETSTNLFNRAVEVRDEGPGSHGALLVSAPIFRLEGVATIEARDLNLKAARGDRLRVEIEDGDSQALESLHIDAVVRQPVLIFDMRGAGTAPAGVLRYGGARGHAPRYDIAGLMPAVGASLNEPRAAIAEQLYDRSRATWARLGDVRANPKFDGAPALAFAMRPGTAIDPRTFTHSVVLVADPSSDGLTRVQLTPEDAATAREDLGDVRVIDADRRQWPYLLQADAGRAWDDLAIGEPEQRRGVSTYRIAVPASPTALDQLVLESDASFFDRAFRLSGETAEDAPVTLAEGRLVLRAERPQAVTIEFPTARVNRLKLTVEDGDEAPLDFRAVRARVIEPELLLVAPAGQYTLLLGDPNVAAPRYELERVRDAILSVSSGSASRGTLSTNPDYSVRARLAQGERVEDALPTVILWIVLILAVAFLAVVTLRLARR